jgi:hypothetical protein
VSCRAVTPLEISINAFTKLAFRDIHTADIEVTGPFDHLEHRLFDLVQVAFLDDQKAENEFA